MTKRKLFITTGLILTIPVLFLLTATALNVLLTPETNVQAAGADIAPTPSQLWVETNKERQRAGIAPLALDPRLNSSALDKCNDMVAKDYYAHDTPDGWDARYFIIRYMPEVDGWSENLTEDFKSEGADSIVQGWMDSLSHRSAILDSKLTRVGFGHCSGPEFDFTVQHFTYN